jgi:DNA-binding response OmpR family regulator
MSHHHHSAPKKSLIIEDDEYLLDIYDTRLQLEGFHVRTLTSGGNIIEEVKNYKPDLLLLDIKLHHGNGLDLLEKIRHVHELARLKVVIVTGLNDLEAKKRADHLQASEYLIKSYVTLADIVEYIKDHLGIHPPMEEDLAAELS